MVKEVISLSVFKKSYILHSKWRKPVQYHNKGVNVSNVCVSCRNIGLGNDLDKKSIQGVVACNKQ